VSYLDQALLRKIAERLGKTPQYIREQASKRANREGVASPAALVMWARDLGMGVGSAVKKLEPHVQQQLSVPRVVPSAGSVLRPRSGPSGPRTTSRKSRRAASASRGVLVFISHSSKDKKLAAKLVELLRSAVSLRPETILCTSVEGHKLTSGSETDESLLGAVLGCKTLIGIISPASRKSTYVLFELGARWATRKHWIPLVAGGVDPGELKGPLGRRHAPNCSDIADVYQLVGDVGTALKMETERPELWKKVADSVVRLSRAGGKKGPRLVKAYPRGK
jgi:hypothetical protein